MNQKHSAISGLVLANPILFGDYRLALNLGEARLYEDLGNFDIVKTVFEEILDEYCLVNKKMNLVMFEDALEHLTRIHRIMRLEQVVMVVSIFHTLLSWWGIAENFTTT